MKSARRTYIYKLTSDRGGAPCAPDPGEHGEPLLTLSICKPAIRRTASPGDRLLGLTSHALASTDEYPLNAVIYAAIVGEAIDARDYYEPASVFQHRPDCIYRFHAANGRMQHGGRTPLHADPAYLTRDLGQYPFYRNGRTLLSHDFRYFGSSAIPIPPRLGELRQLAETLGQGHRVVHSEALERELDALFRLLWKLPTRHTPAIVTDEAYGHTPRAKTKARRTSVKPCF
jgi:hypothetical protein